MQSELRGFDVCSNAGCGALVSVLFEFWILDFKLPVFGCLLTFCSVFCQADATITFSNVKFWALVVNFNTETTVVIMKLLLYFKDDLLDMTKVISS